MKDFPPQHTGLRKTNRGFVLHLVQCRRQFTYKDWSGSPSQHKLCRSICQHPGLTKTPQSNERSCPELVKRNTHEFLCAGENCVGLFTCTQKATQRVPKPQVGTGFHRPNRSWRPSTLTPFMDGGHQPARTSPKSRWFLSPVLFFSILIRLSRF